MEGVNKAVPAVDLLPEATVHGAKGRNADLRGEHQGAARGAGHDRAVDRELAGHPAPGHVALGAVGTRDAPYSLGIAREFAREVQTVLTVGARGGDGVVEPVDPRPTLLAAVAVIDEGVRELMREERRVADEPAAVVDILPPIPGVPGGRIEAEGRRADP